MPIFLGMAVKLCLLFPAQAQIIRDTTLIRALPHITGWADNTHYIVERYQGKSQSRFAVDIHTGKEDILQNKPLVPNLRKPKMGAEEKLPLTSPDGKWVAFLRHNDLYAKELATGKELRYTQDGSETILNGYASWVYYEEILKRNSEYRAFWWSPDSKSIAFYRFDDSRVPVFPLYGASGQHGYTEKAHYPKAGDPNPGVKIGIASVVSAAVEWADFDEQADQYFGKPFWRPDGSGLVVQWMPRRQNNLKLFNVSPETGKVTELYSEKQETWVDWIDRFYWIKDGFLMVRDFEGWEQVYYHNADGKLKRKLTEGKNWQVKLERIDEKAGLLYFSSNAELSTRTDLYRVGLNGKGQRRLTFGPYSHDKVFLSPDGKNLITQYSNVSTPPQIALLNISSGKISQLADAKGKSFDQSAFKKQEIIWLQTKEGFRLPAKITWPVKLEEGRKYPLTIRVYGGPKHQIVSDNWPSAVITEPEDNEQIRVVFEHRGSGNCGKEGLNYLYKNLGKWEMEDYISWIKRLREYPNIDTAKILISGGSYGGYLTALALTYGAEYFRYGIADYPVTDWRLYDSHYTERYMGLPKDNPQGYQFGSVLSHLDKYQRHGPAMLLIQHGLMDDNVHIQHTYQLIDLLQRKNKPFELMVYPTERHGWKGPKVPFTVSRRDYFEERYLFKKD